MKKPSPMILRLSRCAERLWGFTLIELLVVVAIIGILVAIMVPALTGAKDQAIVAKTLSRQRTIGAAYLLYMSDKGTVPLYPTTNANKSDGATMSEIQESLAPYLDLPETTNNVAKLYVNPVWWDGFAEINGYRRVDNGDGGLYYPNTAWTGGPLKYRPTGWDYNYYAHSTYTGTNTDGTPKLTPSEGFTRLNQIANLSKTALMMSRRDEGANDWNSWSDGRRFSATNPHSLGAKRFLVYFDGHSETHVITATNYNASGLFYFK